MSKGCLVISPIGANRSAVRDRADYVLNTYVGPACKQAGYDLMRADEGGYQDIVKGTTTALETAPMAVAYMGPTPESMPASHEGTSYWNANVMIEIGCRLASRLPLIFLCDQDSEGKLPELPMDLRPTNVIALPRPDPQNPRWDNRAQEIVYTLMRQFEYQEQPGRILDSMHPLATITADKRQNTAPDHLYFTAASAAANDLFGVKFEGGQGARLVGRTMDQFLNDVARRMNPAQWRAFERNQKLVRSKLALRATGRVQKQAFTSVPIVFENHEIEEYNHRAFLPIIVQDSRDRDGGYNLRVLYLNVTTATEKAKDEDGEEYYGCRLDPTSDASLEPLKAHKPIQIFLSYRSANRAKVEDVYNRLLAMSPYIDQLFINSSMNHGANWPEVLGEMIKTSELCFLFLDDKPMAPGQAAEVDQIQKRLMTAEGRDYPVVPVLLRSPGPPPRLPALILRQWVKFDDLTDLELRQILSSWFPKRCPADWGMAERSAHPADEAEPLAGTTRSADDALQAISGQRRIMAGKIFISYRRDDSAAFAGRVNDRLEREFGRERLFMDVDAIPLGANFVKILRDEVSKCDVLLAVIGPHWLGLRDENGKRRVDNLDDPVRIEVATALQRGIPVIPILLEGAKGPRREQLPKDLKELALHNWLDVRHASFHSDIDKLIGALKVVLMTGVLSPQ